MNLSPCCQNKLHLENNKSWVSYYKKGDQGFYALSKVSKNLFNISDPIPPTDELKMYRAYYGDQLSLLFTVYGILSMPAKNGHKVMAFGYKPGHIVCFGKIPTDGTMWIPPASARHEELFKYD